MLLAKSYIFCLLIVLYIYLVSVVHFNDRSLKPLHCAFDRCRWCSGLRASALHL